MNKQAYIDRAKQEVAKAQERLPEWLEALRAANEEEHPAQQAYIAEDDHDGRIKFTRFVTLDGHIDLNRVAEILEQQRA